MDNQICHRWLRQLLDQLEILRTASDNYFGYVRCPFYNSVYNLASTGDSGLLPGVSPGAGNEGKQLLLPNVKHSD